MISKERDERYKESKRRQFSPRARKNASESGLCTDPRSQERGNAFLSLERNKTRLMEDSAS